MAYTSPLNRRLNAMESKPSVAYGSAEIFLDSMGHTQGLVWQVQQVTPQEGFRALEECPSLLPVNPRQADRALEECPPLLH